MTQQAQKTGSHRIAVVGLGYVGLPVAIAFAEKYPGTIGFDISERRIEALRKGSDWTGEIEPERLKRSGLHVTRDPDDMREANVFIVCVPTPTHEDHRPDLGPLQSASAAVGKVLRRGGIVVYESTVYPGLTEEVCGPILADVSGLKQGRDFKLGYSPERINPGDREHSFEKIKKVVAGEDAATTDTLCALYGSVVDAGIHRATSIKVAEAAKVLENTQRDLNIALMNELAIICDLMNIRTKDVLDAAGTKWNFLKFAPGLVGGHCIGVDPYYLTSKAQELGYHPEVILAGRRINDTMGAQIARRLVRSLSDSPRPLRDAKIGILGITFKENVPDIRNSKIPDIAKELKRFGVTAIIDDPLANRAEVVHEYGLELCDASELQECDALILAVPHRSYLSDEKRLWSMLREGGVFADIKSAIDPKTVPSPLRYWSL